jgi:hypothetical protein
LIEKLFIKDSELTVFLANGCSVTLSLTFGKTAGPNPQTTFSYKLLTALTPPFDHLIDRYQALFDSDFIPDTLEDYQPWKPLIAKPLFLHNIINF